MFIATTSYLAEDEIASIMAKGFQSVYEKPVVFNRFEDVISRVEEKEVINPAKFPL